MTHQGVSKAASYKSPCTRFFYRNIDCSSFVLFNAVRRLTHTMADNGKQHDCKLRPPLTVLDSRVLMKYKDVTLNPVEGLLKKLLIGCRDHYAVSSSSWSRPASELELRFTGGWVRDKLLGLESHDIDVALSSMTGAQFGEMLKDYVTKHGESYKEEARGASVNDSFKDVHKIKANPEQSKHLETATTRIFGLDIDLVNLRKETYTSDSRNPQVEFGTPKEDADRRDATINAMFYNLDKDAVEDFTGKGLGDLESGIIRTPLAPYETFTDDPLRVLRLIRFASKYGYRISLEAEECMTKPEIHDALNRKITRERVGVEVEKMFGGKISPTCPFVLSAPFLANLIRSKSTPSNVSYLPSWSLGGRISGHRFRGIAKHEQNPRRV